MGICNGMSWYPEALLITVSRMMDVAIGGMEAAKKNRLIRVSRRRNAIGISTDIVTIL